MTSFGRTRGPLLAILALVTALVACGDSITGPIPIEDVEFNPALGIDLTEFTRLPSGVYIKTVVEGSGPPAAEGNQVTVNYELRLPDNTVADPGDAALSFTIGARQVVPGFEQGVTGMRLAEQRRIIVPSSLGYGSSGVGPIPPNATLIFDVTVLAIGS